MSAYYDDYDDGLERGGACNECGAPVDEEWHAYCADCYAEQQGWSRTDRPPLGTPPRSFVEGLADVRNRMLALERRVDALEEELSARLDNAARIVGRLLSRLNELEREAQR